MNPPAHEAEANGAARWPQFRGPDARGVAREVISLIVWRSHCSCRVLIERDFRDVISIELRLFMSQ